MDKSGSYRRVVNSLREVLLHRRVFEDVEGKLKPELQGFGIMLRLPIFPPSLILHYARCRLMKMGGQLLNFISAISLSEDLLICRPTTIYVIEEC